MSSRSARHRATESPPSVCAVWSEQARHLAEDLWALISPWSVPSPVPELLVRRGELLRLREGVYAPPFAMSSMPDRAVGIGCALGPELRGGDVIAGPSAAWVVTGHHLPEVITLETTARPRPLAGVTIRQLPLTGRDVESIGGCPVTVPSRTAVDLLRFSSESQARAGLEALALSGHLDPREVAGRLDAIDAHPFSRRARQRWAQWQPVAEDGVDPLSDRDLPLTG